MREFWPDRPMTRNTILSELHEICSRILAEQPDDLCDFLDQEQCRLESEGHPIAEIKQRAIRLAGAETQAVSTMKSQSSSPVFRLRDGG